MPVHIIQKNITKIRCDAIVNATNPKLFPGGGVDLAIHQAAGPDLYETCQELGGLRVGEAKITPAYNLPCKFIIHTVGPWWDGGEHGERELLKSCYTKALQIAKATKSQSVAFPLISSGLHRFPKEEVLTVALSAIKAFLQENDMQIYLVLYGKGEYALSEALTQDLSAYIEKEYDESFVDEADLPFENVGRRYLCRCILDEDEEESSSLQCDALPRSHWRKQSAPKFDDKELFRNLYDGFALTLMKLIDQKDMSEVECYKRANVSKQTWHKILNDAHYKPSKKTIISFAIALELDLDDTQKLLATAGYILSKSSKFDLIIMYCIIKKIYDVLEIDSILYQYDQETLFSKL